MDARVHDSRRRTLLAAALAAIALSTLPRMTRAQAQMAKLKIGIIGTGRIGGALAEHWARAGHQLMISSRHPEQLRPLAQRLGPQVAVGTPAQAAEFGEVVLISVPYGALPQVGRDHGAALRGKVVLETGNPFTNRDGEMAEAARAKGTGVASAEYLPGVRLVRAFTSVPHTAVLNDAHRSGERIGVPLAADDAEALKLAERLVRDAGFDPVAVGGLARARDFDVGSPVFGRAMTRAGTASGAGPRALREHDHAKQFVRLAPRNPQGRPRRRCRDACSASGAGPDAGAAADAAGAHDRNPPAHRRHRHQPLPLRRPGLRRAAA